jgi:hypothetical protein
VKVTIGLMLPNGLAPVALGGADAAGAG